MRTYRIIYRTRSGRYRAGTKEYRTLREAKRVFAKSSNAKRIEYYVGGGWPRMF